MGKSPAVHQPMPVTKGQFGSKLDFALSPALNSVESIKKPQNPPSKFVSQHEPLRTHTYIVHT